MNYKYSSAIPEELRGVLAETANEIKPDTPFTKVFLSWCKGSSSDSHTVFCIGYYWGTVKSPVALRMVYVDSKTATVTKILTQQ